ncbi:hypothetical protein TWF569_004782 [Orbilia oligospora]|nr:hypothetical protein TWF569_004782 [Orbilia oligospora]
MKNHSNAKIKTTCVKRDEVKALPVHTTNTTKIPPLSHKNVSIRFSKKLDDNQNYLFTLEHNTEISSSIPVSIFSANQYQTEATNEMYGFYDWTPTTLLGLSTPTVNRDSLAVAVTNSTLNPTSIHNNILGLEDLQVITITGIVLIEQAFINLAPDGIPASNRIRIPPFIPKADNSLLYASPMPQPILPTTYNGIEMSEEAAKALESINRRQRLRNKIEALRFQRKKSPIREKARTTSEPPQASTPSSTEKQRRANSEPPKDKTRKADTTPMPKVPKVPTPKFSAPKIPAAKVSTNPFKRMFS